MVRVREKPHRSTLALVIFMGGVMLLLSSCSQTYNWSWYLVSPFDNRGFLNLTFMLRGLLPTIYLSFLAYGCSLVLGLLVSIIGKLHIRGLPFISKAYVAIFRSIPVLVLLLWTYYGLPIVSHISIDIFSAALISMALCESAFVAEIYRTGIESISKSQVESAYVMGANTSQVYAKIIMPQVLRKMLPSLMNQLVYMIKISSLASIIGFEDLTRKANELNVSAQTPLEIYTVLVLEYLLLILVVSALERWIIRRAGPAHDE